MTAAQQRVVRAAEERRDERIALGHYAPYEEFTVEPGPRWAPDSIVLRYSRNAHVVKPDGTRYRADGL